MTDDSDSGHMWQTVKAEALCLSVLQPSDQPTSADVERAIAATLDSHGGPAGCLADLAGEYGDHPELVARRMTWARSILATLDRIVTATDAGGLRAPAEV